MDLHSIIITISTLVATLLGIFGWSHKALRQRISEMELELSKRPSHNDLELTKADIRATMVDKIAPIQVEYKALTRRIDDLQRENHKLNDKIDKLLVICTKMVHSDNDR